MVILEVHIKFGGLPWTRYMSLAIHLCKDTGERDDLSVSCGQYKDSIILWIKAHLTALEVEKVDFRVLGSEVANTEWPSGDSFLPPTFVPSGWHFRLTHWIIRDRLGYTVTQPTTESVWLQTSGVISYSCHRALVGQQGSPAHLRHSGDKTDVAGTISKLAIPPGQEEEDSGRPHITIKNTLVEGEGITQW